MMATNEIQQELAYVLVTELLAYQFAMPVRWSETQRVLFDDVQAIRIIEYGPSATLSNMARRTLDNFNAGYDSANGKRRTLLSISKNQDDIHYENGPFKEIDLEDLPHESIPTQSQASVTPEVPAMKVAHAKVVPDAPISAIELLKALVAHTLKKSVSEINAEDSVTSLSKGRSTIQNEIIGDLLEEFGSLPEGSENLSLREVAATIQPSFDGTLGKSSRKRIERMIASKMPGSFSMSAARSYLSAKWRLGPCRQDAVLLHALTKQPESRLNKTEEAERFFHDVTLAYTEETGLTSFVSDTNTASVTDNAVRLDPKLLEDLRNEQRELKRNISALLNENNDQNNENTNDSLDRWQHQLQQKVDSYEAELGEEFCEGIQPAFRAEQARSYDSAWNWAHVNLLTDYYKLVTTEPAVRTTINEINSFLQKYWQSRSNHRLEQVKVYLLKRLSARLADKGQLTRDIKASLQSAIDTQILYQPGNRAVMDWLVNESYHHETNESRKISIKASQNNIHEGSPLIRILSKKQGSWAPHKILTLYMNIKGPVQFSSKGIFVGKNILITGAGPLSIGMAMLPSLLQGGARVVVTTSRSMPDAGPIYQKIFASHGAIGSQLVVLPCNQASRQDIGNLIKYIYDPVSGLGWDLDAVIPFAAISEKGIEIDAIGSFSELAHRAMLINVLRLMGAVKAAKAAQHIHTRPAQVLLPLSPNLGTFGKDGLYSESKVGLTAVLNKWSSESWSDYLSVCGATIGWTRGTGLMADNDWLATEVAKLGITTFSTEQMADYMLKLMTYTVASVCQTEPLIADISGGMDGESKLAEYVTNIRQSTRQMEDINRALAHELTLDSAATQPKRLAAIPSTSLKERVNLELGFPRLPEYTSELRSLNERLQGMVDLDTVVVVVGFAELGPWGNSRTRWEMEVAHELSIQGCIELAWMTGLIKYSKDTAGWVDVSSGASIQDVDMKAKYERHILENTGLRFITPSPLDHPSRDKKQVLQEIILQNDMRPFVASHDNAMEFVREQGDKVTVRPISGSNEYSITLRKGAVIMIPKATVYDRIVGGQIPTGWDPQVYGLPADICDSVDRCTLWSLVCAAEAFLSAGITDVYDLYKTLHISDLANCIGSGMGGGRSLQKLFVQRYLDRPVQNDILAETFINTASAWLNMLLIGSAGPTRTPVGACATALESLNQGYDLILSGAARICLVGGYDDMTQATSDEFGAMKATNNSVDDLSRGHAPHEMSRPCASSRCGFVESEGCGMQVITSAKLALELGLPIRSIIAHVQTASDGIGRSVPAPGKGILTAVSETTTVPPPLLDINYRRRLLQHSLDTIREHHASLPDENSENGTALWIKREEREARRRFGNKFYDDDARISPLRGALAVWGLVADDIAVVSMHGTSTQMNEKNEVEVLHRQLDQIGRSPGNSALAVCQKYLTGHPKGPAAAWMLNGCLQILDSGIVPGNKNADNIDSALAKWEHLVFPNESIHVGEVNAFTVTSFGFGQKGAQALGVHPKFLFGTLDHAQYQEYCRLRQGRHSRAQQQFQNAFYGGRMVMIKDKPPYRSNQQLKAYMDPSGILG
ncbi:3-oxoacyl-[acyl-carrier-protein] synthase, putative [Talaromyces stipitatus ATCC 10500]|uniref:3-oxoacyl-[acyl-carrier-protein] synthase, putative n=1 Tax=Talaromyces stipitatus (strain ATCC 10500 / CBS 375.48 / QM 6759 / NRRL 1006) TaxID=441959 RepID=B8LZM1_TALSN|nr:3-oxoacyl-[acyl-carrier-protein] synthase, putative [Talaromyces stipitatus ATCC 10500]EED22444.1 3-oxoacyl-[acyl-carrier-protein] synthase, putative [Talaromyces stipitatus ATCC 10500]